MTKNQMKLVMVVALTAIQSTLAQTVAPVFSTSRCYQQMSLNNVLYFLRWLNKEACELTPQWGVVLNKCGFLAGELSRQIPSGQLVSMDLCEETRTSQSMIDFISYKNISYAQMEKLWTCLDTTSNDLICGVASTSSDINNPSSIGATIGFTVLGVCCFFYLLCLLKCKVENDLQNDPEYRRTNEQFKQSMRNLEAQAINTQRESERSLREMEAHRKGLLDAMRRAESRLTVLALQQTQTPNYNTMTTPK